MSKMIFSIVYCAASVITELFHQFDKNNDGAVSADELEVGLRCVNGSNPSKKEIADLKKEFGITNGGKVPFEKFSKCLERYVQTDKKDKDAERRSLHASFQVFDRNKNGTIEKEELRTTLLKLGEKACDVDKLFKSADINQDGKIQYTEFIEIFLRDMK